MNEYLRPFRGRIDRRHICRATVVVIGVGRIGGPIGWELARLVPRRVIVVDGDDYEPANQAGHPLPRQFLYMNKAISLAAHIQAEIPGIAEVKAIPDYLDPDDTPDRLLREVIEPAAVVVVATDNLAVQRYASLAARSVGVPAIVPGIREDGQRGEVFLSLGEGEPCLRCFDGFRADTAPIRGAALLGPDGYPTVQLAFSLALAALDPDSRGAVQLLTPLQPGGPVPQLFRAWSPGSAELGHADDGRTLVEWRDNCPGCGGQRRQAVRPPQPARTPDEHTRALANPVFVTPPPLPQAPSRQSDEDGSGVVVVICAVVIALLIKAGASVEIALIVVALIIAIGFGLWLGARGSNATE